VTVGLPLELNITQVVSIEDTASVIPYAVNVVGFDALVTIPLAFTVTDLYVPGVTPLSSNVKLEILSNAAAPLVILIIPLILDGNVPIDASIADDGNGNTPLMVILPDDADILLLEWSKLIIL
jgi:hypothetical protein